MTEILSAIIGALGVIIAAIIARFKKRRRDAVLPNRRLQPTLLHWPSQSAEAERQAAFTNVGHHGMPNACIQSWSTFHGDAGESHVA